MKSLTIKQIEEIIKAVEVPNRVVLAPGEVITDVHRFLDTSLSVLKAQTGNKAYLPYYHRLNKLANLLLDDT